MSEETQTNLVTLYAPEGATELNFAGQIYTVVDGAVDVPHAAVEELLHHGYTTEPLVSAEEEQAAIAQAVEAVKEQKRRGRPAKAQTEELQNTLEQVVQANLPGDKEQQS